MKHLLDVIGLYVNEGGKRYVYKRIVSGDGIPNYYPPPDKNQVYTDMYVDEILFLPIELDDFNNDRTNKFIGYRYLINTSGHETVSLGPDPLKLGVTSLQLSVEVQRIRFYMKGEIDIVIDKVFDPLYPPRILTVQYRSFEVGMRLQELVRGIVDNFNAWYIDKQV